MNKKGVLARDSDQPEIARWWSDRSL